MNLNQKISQLRNDNNWSQEELADKLKVQPSALVKKLFLAGKVVTINQDITFDEAE